jgi:3-dehydroquinate dehydratase
MKNLSSNAGMKPKRSVTAETTRGTIAGFGLRTHFMGLGALLEMVEDAKHADGNSP